MGMSIFGLLEGMVSVSLVVPTTASAASGSFLESKVVSCVSESKVVSVVSCIESVPGASSAPASKITSIGGDCIGIVVVVEEIEVEATSEGNFGILGEEVVSREEVVVFLITGLAVGGGKEIGGASVAVRS